MCTITLTSALFRTFKKRSIAQKRSSMKIVCIILVCSVFSVWKYKYRVMKFQSYTPPSLAFKRMLSNFKSDHLFCIIIFLITVLWTLFKSIDSNILTVVAFKASLRWRHRVTELEKKNSTTNLSI